MGTYVSINDVRLVALPEPEAGPGPTETPTGTTTPTTPPTTTSPTPVTSPDEGIGTPGPGVLLLVGVLAGAVAWRRLRH